MAWRRPGDKPLSEPKMVGVPTHICVTRPQWVKVPHVSQFESITMKTLKTIVSELLGDGLTPLDAKPSAGTAMLKELFLTHWHRDKMAAILQITFSSVLPWMNFEWNFIEICPLVSTHQCDSIGSDNGLVPIRRQAIIWTNDCMFNWRMYESLGPSERLLNTILSVHNTLFTSRQ